MPRRFLNALALKYKIGDLFEYSLIRFNLGPKKFKVRNALRTVQLPEIDEAHIVSLPFRLDRRVEMENQFKGLSIRYFFHDAIHGAHIDLNSISRSTVSDQSRRYLSKGSIGALLSHYQLWEILYSRPQQYHLILEDDAIIPSTLSSKITSILKQVPTDFDILYLGSGCKKSRNTRALITQNLYEPYFPRKGLYSYLVTRVGLKKLLNHTFPVKITCGSLDTIVGNLVRLKILSAFHVCPDICTVNLNSPSNVYNFSQPTKMLHANEL
jgi:GR25 family glycosyltransferase involved in LPS biosynthesis